MYNPDLSQIKDAIAKDVYTAILSNKTIQKHTTPYTFFSGCSTEVYPITLWGNSVEVHLDSGNRNFYHKAIQKVVENNPQLFSRGYFCTSDGSYPSFLRFIYSEALLERIKES